MKHTLDFGFYGIETKTETGSMTSKTPEEPTFSIDKVVKFFKVENEKIKVDIDWGTISGYTPEQRPKINKIWEEITSKEFLWKELRPKLIEWMKITRLPIVFEMNLKDLKLDIIDGEHTITVCHDDLEKLKELQKQIEEERSKRTSAWAQFGTSTTLK